MLSQNLIDNLEDLLRRHKEDILQKDRTYMWSFGSKGEGRLKVVKVDKESKEEKEYQEDIKLDLEKIEDECYELFKRKK